MTDIIVDVLNWLNNLIYGFIPDMAVPQGAISNIFDSLDRVLELVQAANYLIPLPDMLLMVSFDVAIRVFKMGVFISNWVIKRTFDVIP